MLAVLPDHITALRPANEREVEDSLFWTGGHAFPEVREELWPHRAFPLPRRNTATGEGALRVQASGLQYSVHTQLLLERGLEVERPPSWSRERVVWTDVPVFTEEPCEWHYPRVCFGYNTAQVEPPSVLRPDLNRPRPIGFLPNGDLIACAAIAEVLASEFLVDLEPLPSSIDRCALLVAEGCDESVLLDTPVGRGVDVGIVLSQRELPLRAEAQRFIDDNGGTSWSLEPSRMGFHILRLPVIGCEWDLNRYTEAVWEDLDIRSPQLNGFAFRIVDTPACRGHAMFSTERGNLVVSRALFARLEALISNVNPKERLGCATPVLQTP